MVFLDMLNKEELQRYDRQILYFKKEGQEKLKKAKVLIIGAGGLGGLISTYLTLAGIGNIKIIDFDKVDITNLNRQILYNKKDLNKYKAIVAKQKLKKLNNIKIKSSKEFLDKNNVLKIIKPYDIIVDALDNTKTRLIVSDACENLKKPLVFGAVEGMKGMQTTCTKKYLRSFLKETPKKVFPILGPTAGFIASLQSLEVIKLILKRKTNNKLLIFNAENNQIMYLKI